MIAGRKIKANKDGDGQSFGDMKFFEILYFNLYFVTKIIIIRRKPSTGRKPPFDQYDTCNEDKCDWQIEFERAVVKLVN